MRNIVTRLWTDDAGFVVSTELVLASTQLVIGITVGQAAAEPVELDSGSDIEF